MSTEVINQKEFHYAPATDYSSATFLLASSMFFTGGCGLVVEYILSTVSTYILGNSIEQFSIIIALMMLMMGVAGYVQKFVSDERLIEKFIGVEICLALLSGFAPIAMYWSFGMMEDHFMLVQYFLVMSVGFLIGFEMPLVLRINQRYSKTLGTNIANIYSPDYIGGFIFTLVWVHFLLKSFPLTEISFLVAGINFLVAAITLFYFIKHNLISRKLRSVLLIVFTFLALFYGYSNNRVWNLNLEQKLYDYPIVFAETTRYQRLVITYNKALGEYRFFINGNLQFSSHDEEIYHEQLVHPVMSLVPDHQKVLVLGGGDGLALREILKYNDVKDVTLVDLDPGMVKACSSNPILTKLNNDAFRHAKVKVLNPSGILSEGRKKIYQDTGKIDSKKEEVVQKIAYVDIINIDADKFIRSIKGKWNVIIIDFPDPNSIELVKLYSKEFFLKLRHVLAENGMFVMQVTSPYHAKEAFLCIKRTMEAAGFNTLPYHDNVPSFGDWGWILGWKKHISSKRVKRGIENMEFDVETRYLTPAVFRKALVFGKRRLESKHNDISTLMYPVLLYRYIDDSWLDED